LLDHVHTFHLILRLVLKWFYQGAQGLPNLNGSQSSSAISSHEKSLNIYNTAPRRSIGPIAKFSPQDITDHVSLWGLLQPLRTQLKQYVNVRPVRVLRGVASPLRNVPHEFINWLIIRENSEGEYAGHGGISHGDTAHGVATDVSIFTRPAIERIFRFAFDTARQRPRKRLTLITKSNAQKWGMVYCKSYASFMMNRG
jgi:isocitrate/isopropylmalate dehydrogenase